MDTTSPIVAGTPQPTAASNDTAFRTTAIERKSWQATFAPQFIPLFLWVVFYDQLPVKTLAIGGLGPSVAGLAAGGVLCFLLLYYAPAMWGFRTGQPLVVVSQSTFGTVGASWLTGVVFGLAQVVWFAVGVYFATELILKSFAACRLLDPRACYPVSLGRYTVPSRLFLIASAFWCCWAGLVGAYIVRVIAALMRIFPVFPAAMLAVAMLMTIKGAVHFQPVRADLVTGQAIAHGELIAFLNMLQLVFAFFATAGLAATDWGAVSREPSDVRVGGFVGVIFAPWAIGTLVLLIVAGARGTAMAEAGRAVATASVTAFTFHEVIYNSIEGRLACAILLVLGLASLAPTTYTSFVVGARLSAVWPRISRVAWSVAASVLAWLLILANVPGKLDDLFGILGAVFAPMAGAMAADYVYHRGKWPGPRGGVNQAGLVAWVAGLAVGLLPTIGRSWGLAELARFQPAAVAGCLVALFVYLALAALGGESPALAVGSAPAMASDVSPEAGPG
ncbi:MAG: purine-cytosine permease-like transporter [Isosphaeraceae bacterium]|nr:purine-cytosine permease-like transporter [Isosphaeraceae bacterium]